MNNDVFVLAHEIKNPLCVVKGYLEMIDESNFSKYKRIIDNELNNSLLVLDNYLEYNKIIVNRDIMDINMLFLDLKDMLKDYLLYNHVSLHINFIDDDVYINGDYSKLKQVFVNLIKNSKEALAKNIIIDLKVVNEKVIIKLIDDGCGIEDINKIGENYSSKVFGNGIGINLSKKIIGLHNGSIIFKNNKGKGINIIITLLMN